MTVPGTNSGSFLGAGNGPNWTANTQGHSGSSHVSGQSTGGATQGTSQAFPNPFAQFAGNAAAQAAAQAAVLNNSAAWYVGGGGGSSGSVYYAGTSSNTHVLVGHIPTPPHQPTLLKSEAMIAGEIIGWRGWNIKGNAQLASVTSGDIWDSSVPMEGDPASGYGIHAYKDSGGPLHDGYIGTSTGMWVLGEVALWGDVIEHEFGFRSQFARVHSLVMWSKDVPQKTRDEIHQKYLSASKFVLPSEDAA